MEVGGAVNLASALHKVMELIAHMKNLILWLPSFFSFSSFLGRQIEVNIHMHFT